MSQVLRIAIGSDHGGFEMKQELVPYLKAQGHQVADSGAFSKDAVDYPRMAANVASAVSQGST